MMWFSISLICIRQIHIYHSTSSIGFCFLLIARTKATKCDRTAEGFYCDFLIQSIWFQIHNTTAVPVYAAACDKAFIGKYGDIMYCFWNEVMD